MKRLLLLCICLGFPACRNGQKKLIRVDQTCFSRAQIKKRTYRLRIAGVECKQCVWTVLRILNGIKSVSDVSCVCHKKRYDEAYFLCTFHQRVSTLSIDEIKKRLAEENFEIESFYGRFNGMVLRKNTEYFLQMRQTLVPVKLLADQAVLELLSKHAARGDTCQLSVLGTWRPDENSLHIDDVEL